MHKKSFFIFAMLLVTVLLLTACAGTPKLQEGERYFEGDVDFELAESCTVSYILSPDGQSVHDIKIVMKNYAFKTVYKDDRSSVNINKKVGKSTIFLGKGTPDAQGYLEANGTEVSLRFNFTSDGATGEMDYTYKGDPDDNNGIKFEIYIGTYPFVMEDRTDTLET